MTTFAQAAAAVDTLAAQLQALVEDARFVPRFFDTLFGLRTALGSARDRFAATPGEGDRPAYATAHDRSEQAVAIGVALTPDDAAVARYAAAVARAVAALGSPSAVTPPAIRDARASADPAWATPFAAPAGVGSAAGRVALLGVIMLAVVALWRARGDGAPR